MIHGRTLRRRAASRVVDLLVHQLHQPLTRHQVLEAVPQLEARAARVQLLADRVELLLAAVPALRVERLLQEVGVVDPGQFDGNGNYTFGLNEQSMFHEIDQDAIDRVRGMDITVVTTAKTDDEGRALLKALGFPYKEK